VTTTEGGPAVGERPLDPFAVPGQAGARFLLVIVTGVAGAVYVYAWVVGLFGSGFRGPVADGRTACVADARRAVGTADPADPADLTTAFSDCVQRVYRDAFLVEVGMVVLLILATTAGYLLAPRLVVRSPVRALRAVATNPDAAEIVAHVERTVATAGQPVEVSVATLRKSDGARAFGRLGRYRIVIDLGLLTRARRDPTLVRGVVAHEVAHIRNRDIDITYLTISAWWAFVAVVVLPAVVVAVREPYLRMDLYWRLPVLLLVMWLARTAVLRSREYYADLRAAERGDGAIVEALSARADRRGWRRWLVAASYHPPERSRLAVLAGEPRLFRLEPWAAGTAGVLVGFGYAPVSFLLSLVWPASVFVRDWMVGLALGVLAAAAVAGSAWRATLRSIVDGRPPPSTWVAAVALTAGILAGQSVTPEVPTAGAWGLVVGREPLVGVAVAGILLVTSQLFLRWVVNSARAWLPGATRPYRVAWFGTAQAAALYGLWMSSWFAMVASLYGSRPSWQTLTIVPASAVVNPVLLLSVMWAVSYLAAGWIRRRAVRPLASYGYAVVVAVVCGAAGIFTYPWIRAWVGVPYGSLRVLAVMAAVAAATAAVSGLVVGVTLGGRDRTGRVVAVAGLGLVAASVVVLPLTFVHVQAALCWDGPAACRPDWQLVATGAFSGLNSGILALLLIAGIGAAALGSAARSVAGRRRDGPPADTAQPADTRRHGLAVAVALLPALLAAGPIAWYGLRAFAASGVQTGYTPAQRAFLQEQAARVRPDWLTRAQACEYARLSALGGQAADVLDNNYLARLVTTAVAAASSDDPALRALGTEAGRALLDGALARNHRANMAIGDYCVIVDATQRHRATARRSASPQETAAPARRLAASSFSAQWSHLASMVGPEALEPIDDDWIRAGRRLDRRAG
jgi:Zn-dependent protease with chaperone function